MNTTDKLAEALRNGIDAMQESIDRHIQNYGLDYRQERLSAMMKERQDARDALADHEAAQAAPAQPVAGWLDSGIKPRALPYPLHDYSRAMSEGPLHYTWQDKPHRLVYDLIAAVRFYAAPQPKAEPAPGLLMSMAIRYDHALALPGYYDNALFAGAGVTHAQRLEGTLITMRQLWEEVTGNGFYRLEREAEYAAIAAATKGQP